MIQIARTTDLAACLELRRVVFVLEQGVAPAEDVDGLDEGAEHFLAVMDGRPVGTARLRLLDGGTAKGERMCVLTSARKRGVAGQILEALEARARELGAHTIAGAAQVQALALYTQRGYVPSGDEFLDAGIPHRAIQKPLGELRG